MSGDWQTKPAGSALADFMSYFDDAGPFEIETGVLRPAARRTLGQSWVAGRLFDRLGAYASVRGLGVVLFQVPLLISGEDVSHAAIVRVADMVFIRGERWRDYVSANAGWRGDALRMAPELVVDTISPTDRYGSVMARLAAYLEMGVLVVWVIYPPQAVVTVFRAGQRAHETLGEGDTLEGGEVLPGFAVAVGEIFAD